MKNWFPGWLAIVLLGTILSINPSKASAAPPDPDTEAFVRQQYSLLLFTGRSCAYFANPKTVEQKGDDRFIWILNTSTPDTGSLCRGVFRFLWLNVNCPTNTLTFTDSAPSLEEQRRKRIEYVDEAVAQKVCALPTKPIPQK